MKKLYVFVLSVIAVLAANAEPVSRSEALQKARQFMPGKQFNADQAFSRSKRVMADKEPFYIFNAEEGGFVVISGDDRTVPVIGYSEKGQLLQDDMPDNLRNWLDGYAEQLQAIENGEATPALPRSAKVTRGVSAKPAIAPLIKTQWNQSGPYSLLTPTYTHTNNNNEVVSDPTVTGCVATALAQVMNYYQWPASCLALEGYTTSTLELNVKALPATTFKWSLMKNSYSDSETGEEAYEVSKLMRYIGQAIHMNYNLGENGGSAGSADMNVMINTFGYSKHVYSESRGNYTTAEWEDMLYRELAAGRPVLYDGAANTGTGHQFICDGYDGNGLFHINWGWGSYQDNYFVISLANPTDTGIGGGSGKSGYIFRQAAVFGFQPATDGEPEIPRINSNVDAFSASYSYVPTTTYPVEAGWALWQNDQVLSVFEAYTKNTIIDYTKLNVGWSYSYSSPKSVSFGAGIPDGDYRLVQVWRPQGSTEDWTVMSSMKSLRVNISGNTLTICKPQYTPVTYTVNSVDFGGKLAVGKVAKIVVNLTNTCDANQEPLYLWVGDGSSWAGKSIASVDPGTTGNAEILYTPTNSGEYSVKITSDESGNEVMWSSTITIYGVVQTTIDGIVYKYVEGDDYADIVGSEASVFENQPLVIPSTVTIDAKTYYIRKIESSAFRLVKMTSLTIGDGVESIETQAFMFCYSLTEVTLPSTLKSIGTSAFYNSYKVASLVIPEGVESIGASAFAHCHGLRDVTLPSTLQSIGEQAFASKYLKNLISNMQHPCTIASNAFDQVDLAAAALYVPEGTKSEYQAAPVWKDFGSILQGEVKEIEIAGITYRYITGEGIADIIAADAAVLNSQPLVIPGSIIVDSKSYKLRKIENWVFRNVNMTSLTIEPGLEEIGDYNFYNRNNLKKVVIPEGVKAIGAYAFNVCYGLTDLTLPSTLQSIGEYAFACPYLKNLTSNMQHPCAINANVFDQVNLAAATLYIPEGTKSEYLAAAVWQDFGTMLQGEVKEIEIAGITYRYITGEGIADIIAADKTALEGKDLVIGNVTINEKTYRVRKIEKQVFMQINVKSLTIEPGLEEIGNYAFLYSSFGDKLIIPEGVKTIGESAFRSCFYYSELSLPSTLTSIGNNAFARWYYLTDVIYSAKDPFAIADDVFTPYNGLDLSALTLTVPAGSIAKYQAADGWKLFTKFVEIDAGDSNRDGTVSVTDIAFVVNSILAIANEGNFFMAGADANGDGVVTVTDIGVIVDIILGTNNARRMTRDAVEPQ